MSLCGVANTRVLESRQTEGQEYPQAESAFPVVSVLPLMRG